MERYGLLVLATVALLASGRAGASPVTGLVFDDENAIAATHTVPSNPQVDLGVGATISVATDTPITNFSLLTFQLNAGSSKFIVYDETTSTYLYKSTDETFAADTFDNQGNANFTFKSSPTFSLTLLGGQTYDLGAIADVEDYYAYNRGPSVVENGITGGPENVLLRNYSDPVLAPNPNTPDKIHGTAEFALQIQNGSAVEMPEPPTAAVFAIPLLVLALSVSFRSRRRRP